MREIMNAQKNLKEHLTFLEIKRNSSIRIKIYQAKYLQALLAKNGDN